MDRYIDRYKYIQIRSTLSVYQLAQEQDTIISIKNACGFSLFTFIVYPFQRYRTIPWDVLNT